MIVFPDLYFILYLSGGYLATFILSTIIVRLSFKLLIPKNEKGGSDLIDQKTRNTGLIIGICENFLVLTFILFNEITGLALIFAAKSIIRKDKMTENAAYYLAGTMINFTFSVFMGYLLKWFLSAI